MSGPFSAPFTAGAFLAGRALLEKLYFLFVISAAVGSAVTCAHVVLTTKRSRGETQPDSHLIIETRVRRLNALFTVALVASAAFVIDGVLNCLWYVVSRVPGADIAPVLRFYWWMTQIFVLSLLAMEAMKWIASNAAARVRRNC